MRRFRVFIWPVCCLLMSLLLNTLGASENLNSVVAQRTKISASDIKNWTTILSNVLFVAPLCFMSVRRGGIADNAGLIKKRYSEKQREAVYAVLKVKGYIDSENDADFNVRIFRKHFKHLVSEDVDGMYDMPIKRKLSFSIDKDQGLCVMAYKEKKTMAELEDASLDRYNLNKQQLASAGAIKFMVATPVCGENNNKVKYVICFDSFKKIGKQKHKDPIMSICEKAAYEIYDVIKH